MAIRRATTQRITIDDVAKEAGVSTATVSRVINGKGTVSDRTTKKVNQAITDLKFVAHGSARTLAGTKTHAIGLFFPGITTPFFSDLIRGISTPIYERGYSLLMYGDLKPVSMTSGRPLPLGEHNTDGIIVFTDFLDDYSIRHFYERQLPVVMLHRSPPTDLAIPKIKFANEEGSYTAVRHLLDNGYRKIAYLRGPDGNEDSEQRERGYRRALAEQGIAIDETLIAKANFAAPAAERIITQMLDKKIKFDAVFAGDDNSAWGTINILQKRGINIPEEVAVVGFNDDLLSRYSTPALTTVRAPIYDSGFRAAEKLFSLIDGNDVPRETLLPTELVIRESSVGGAS